MLEEEAAGGTSGPCGGQPGTCSMDAASHWSWPCLVAPGTCVVELCEACGGDLPGVWDTCSLSPCSPCSVPARQLGALGPWSSGWWPVRQHTKVSASSQTWEMSAVGLFFKKKPQPIGPPWHRSRCPVSPCVSSPGRAGAPGPSLGALHPQGWQKPVLGRSAPAPCPCWAGTPDAARGAGPAVPRMGGEASRECRSIPRRGLCLLGSSGVCRGLCPGFSPM